MAEKYARELLQRQLVELNRHPPEGISVGVEEDMFKWDIMLIGPSGTAYEGGFFKATLTFPKNFPNMPPEMQFTSSMFHPNVFPDGKVCISILHPPGEDKFNDQESADERWRPILGVEQILVSVISMLSDPNFDSPANIDAAVMFRDNKTEYKKACQRCVRKSQEDM